MSEHYLPYETLLDSVRSAELKRIAQRWGATTETRKDQFLALIHGGLRNPKRVREVAARLPDLDRAALGLARMVGNRIDPTALTAGLRAWGAELPKQRSWHSQNDTWLSRHLAEYGTLLSSYTNDPTYIGEYGGAMLVADERLLAAAEPPPIVPFSIAPAPDPAVMLERRPATVGMEIAALLQAIDTLGGLQITKAGDVRTGELRKLARALKWPDQEREIDGLRFPRPVAALAAALAASGALERTADKIVLHDRDAFVSQPYSEQVSTVLRGFLHVASWHENDAEDDYDFYESRYVAMRMALVVALAALPDMPGAFFAIDDLSAALFARVGEHVSLGFGPHAPYLYNKSPAEIRKAEEEWRAQLRASWQSRERPWIVGALTSWAYFLGLVELGMAHDIPVSVRLSELGRAVLHGAQESAAQPSGAAWVVQPDFEVLAYLDHATPAQLAFLERHAERAETQAHVARYRLTRDAIHGGLESGTSPEQLLSGLEAGASTPLPQNVLATLRDWAAQRERITLRRSVVILEFPDGPARDAALQDDLDGQPVGERFVLLPTRRLAQPHTHLDYSGPLPPCLTATEEGQITLAKPTPDLLLRAQLGQWAEQQSDTTWRLTASSVAAAVKAGGSIETLLTLLRQRLIDRLPPLLGVALRAWAGKAPPISLATVTVLRCPQPEVFAAIAGSPMFAPYLHGTLAPDVLLVDPQQLAGLRERLAWAGLSVSEHSLVTLTESAR